MNAPTYLQSPHALLDHAMKAGSLRIGEILIRTDFTLRHGANEEGDDLEVFNDPADARNIARFDADGRYRPLKTAPNLRRGWVLEAGSLEGIFLALDFFYPAAIGLWFSWFKGTLAPTPFRETLKRQTGMYRVTQLITDQQAEGLLLRCCNSETGCLRKILWEMSPDHPWSFFPASKRELDTSPGDLIPLICREVCHLVIAAASPIAKGNLSNDEAINISFSDNDV